MMKEFLPYFSVVVSLLALGYAVTRNNKTDAETFKKEIRDSVVSVDKRVAVVEFQNALFLKNLTITMGNVLHSPHPEDAETDYLIEQLQAGQITEDEKAKLIQWLGKLNAEHHHKTVKTVAAGFMMAMLQTQADSERFAQAMKDRT